MPPEKEYQPIFLNAIRRNGYYTMSYETFLLYTQSCTWHYSGRKSFGEWLEENKLKTIVGDKQVKIEKV